MKNNMKNNMENYLSRFLNLKCSGDILNVVNPINAPEKEISESWSIIRKIKPLVLSHKMKYNILDLCAGNALTSVISVFVLPVEKALAIDIKKRKRHYEHALRFDYQEYDIYNKEIYNFINRNTIIVASHPCKHALRIIEIFNNSLAKALCIIPCCTGNYNLPMMNFLRSKLPKYDVWVYYLGTLIDAKILSITTDMNCLSPKNNVIYAER